MLYYFSDMFLGICDVSLHVICHQFITYSALYQNNKTRETTPIACCSYVATRDLGTAAYYYSWASLAFVFMGLTSLSGTVK
jgi:hypothetical protein